METTVITTEPGLAPVVSHGAGVLDAVPVFGFTTAAYVVAAVLFILALGGLSGQESAKRAIWYGIVGMALAVLATLFGPGLGHWWLSLIMIAIGGGVGYVLATRVQMTEMPQLVAAMHSLVALPRCSSGSTRRSSWAGSCTPA